MWNSDINKDFYLFPFFKIILIMAFNMIMIFFRSQDFQRITAYSFLSSIFRQLMLYSQSFLPGIPTP